MFEGRIKRDDWYVADVDLPTASGLVRKHHYAKGASNTRTYLHGIYWTETLSPLGVAWWIPPTRSAAEATFPANWRGVLALSRMVLVPGVPKNAATFLLSRSVKLIDRQRWPCLVTYADEWQGHDGGVYLAAGWEFVGMTKPERTYVLDGRMIARKAGPTTRTHAEMLQLGATCVGAFAKRKFQNVKIVAERRKPGNVFG